MRNRARIFEIIIVFLLFLSLTILVFFIINPQEIFRRSRDSKRFDDLMKIRSALDNYSSNHDFHYPEDISFLTSYLSPIPIDPLLQADYGYKANDDLSQYEINANLESTKYQVREVNDGGDNEELYEIGNNLNLIEEGLFNNFGYNPAPKIFKLLSPENGAKVELEQVERNCLFKTKLAWEEAEDPSDKLKYYYYLDSDKNFVSPELSGNTVMNEVEVQKLFENYDCEKLESIWYWVIVAQDSGGNLVSSTAFEMTLSTKEE